MRPALLALAIVAFPAIGHAQQNQTAPTDPVIIVVGRGEAERAPDYGDVTVRLLGEGDTQVEALAALEASQTRITSGLGALEGAETELAETGEVILERVYGPDCEADQYDPRRSTGACTPQGYVTRMSVTFRVMPADQVGRALSLAAELGATHARAEDFGLIDADSLRNEAAAAAFADAREQAELIARASGAQLGRIIRIQDGAANYNGSYDGVVEGIVVTGSRIRPAVSLTVTPDPVEATASLTVVYELLD